jgi:hypothetical protein
MYASDVCSTFAWRQLIQAALLFASAVNTQLAHQVFAVIPVLGFVLQLTHALTSFTPGLKQVAQDPRGTKPALTGATSLDDTTQSKHCLRTLSSADDPLADSRVEQSWQSGELLALPKQARQLAMAASDVVDELHMLQDEPLMLLSRHLKQRATWLSVRSPETHWLQY